MAHVYVKFSTIVVTSFNKCIIYNTRSGVSFTCQIPPIDSPDANDSNKHNGKEEGSDQILAAVFSPSGKYFAASDDQKRLVVWNVESGWTPVNTRFVPRRATALVFAKCGEQILVADKAGDVHRFSVSDNGSATGLAGTLVVGHVSMLLDVKLCSSDQYVVTCDRDEKIRVSCYPNAYNIQSFCLGHTDFVNRLAYLEDCNLLLSGSGDGTLKLWNYVDGELLDSADCASILEQDNSEMIIDTLEADSFCQEQSASAAHSAALRSIAVQGRCVAVGFECRPVVLLFTVTPTDDSSRILFRHRLLLSAPVWDVVFIDSNHILVLQSQTGEMAVSFKFSDCTTLSDVAPLASDADTDIGLIKTTKKINEDDELYKASQKASSLLPVLRKAHIDNMSEYIEKKKQLIKNKKLLQDVLVSKEDSTKKLRLNSS